MPIITEASARFSIPADWIARVIRLESGGASRLHGEPIRSRAGAIGLMQLMPGTWRDMRERYSLGLDPDDPHDNIMAGTAYLGLLYQRFGYPWLFAAYNAGPARVGAVWQGTTKLPKETRFYLSSALRARVTETPDAGLFPIRPRPTSTTDPRPDRLFAISRALP